MRGSVVSLGCQHKIYLFNKAGKNLTQDVQLTATDVKAVTPEILRVEIPVGVPLPWPT
ncbi:hypothetical protein [Candidatus Symbiopectobacterium sp.]|uniref:hypothetical protein n=1 Tax=Candidatus Symbiopectobacterium sp. TaxID=2816440 RepID=UPI00345DED1D